MDSDQHNRDVYTEMQAAEYLQMSPRKLFSLRKAKKIVYVQDGSRIKYLSEHLQDYLDAQTVPVQEVH